MALKRPKRKHYESEPDFLLACLRYLDAKYPGREGQRKRIAAWQRWTEEHDPDLLVRRIREILRKDALDADDRAELYRLIGAWKTCDESARKTPDTSERNGS